MPQEKLKQRLGYTKQRAVEKLTEIKYDIINSDNDVVCFIAVRKEEVRFIRVTVDKISELDIEVMKRIQIPMNCKKEIWCKPRNKQKFEIMEV